MLLKTKVCSSEQCRWNGFRNVFMCLNTSNISLWRNWKHPRVCWGSHEMENTPGKVQETSFNSSQPKNCPSITPNPNLLLSSTKIWIPTAASGVQDWFSNLKFLSEELGAPFVTWGSPLWNLCSPIFEIISGAEVKPDSRWFHFNFLVSEDETKALKNELLSVYFKSLVYFQEFLPPQRVLGIMFHVSN